MGFVLQAGCFCHTGKVRKNNEDNFCFRRKTLQEDNKGLKRPLGLYSFLHKPVILGVFDGIGGAMHGETASFITARTVAMTALPGKAPEQELEQLCLTANEHVHAATQMLMVRQMGSTLTMICFFKDRLYACNLGDSKIFRLSQGKLEQISVDHTDEKLLLERGIQRRPRLTQHIGVDPQELRLEPAISQWKLEKGDQYLICSDGLTDMVESQRIQTIMETEKNPKLCAKTLVQEALDNGGKDNTTVIVCKIK